MPNTRLIPALVCCLAAAALAALAIGEAGAAGGGSSAASGRPAAAKPKTFEAWCEAQPKRSFDRKRKLTFKQIRCLARKSGWGRRNAVRAAAVAMAESRGLARAVEYNGGWARGLFQIDRRYWEISERCVFRASCNARFAYRKVFDLLGWRGWSTYTKRRGGQRHYPYCYHLRKRFKRSFERRCL